MIIKNKKIKYILVGLIVIILVGFFVIKSRKTEKVIINEEKVEEEVVVLVQEETIEENQSLEICQAGSRTIFLDREDGKYRTENTGGDVKLYAVFDGNNFYSWNSENSEGKKFSLECMESLNLEPTDEKKEEDSEFEDYLNFGGIIAISKNCKKYEKDVNFSFPENIKFHSYCELLKKQMELLR